MMAQWQELKTSVPGALLFFRMGDFYEAFYEDAATLATELELTLTKRQEIPMAGVPYHASEGYIDKLVAKGYRIAVAEQMEDPKAAKGLVKRAVTRIVTPGTVINSSLLSEKTNNFFASLTQVGQYYGLAFLDLTTGEFRAIEFDTEQALLNEIHRLRPSEFLTSDKFYNKNLSLFDDIKQSFETLVNTEDDWRFNHQIAHDFLTGHFSTHNLDGFGLKGMIAGINASGALLHYLKDTLCLPIDHVRDLSTYSTSEYLSLDRISQRNLELTESLSETKKNTLIRVLDHTMTPMGARLMRQWIKQPLLDPEKIAKRQDAVEAFFRHEETRLFEPIKDLERLMMKITSGFASPRDLNALAYSLIPLPQVQSYVHALSPDAELLRDAAKQLTPLPELTELIGKAISDEPPLRLSDGGAIRDGFSKELDDIRRLSNNGKEWIAQYQNELRETLGIKTLKVGYNRMFGYYIEVSKGQTHLMPDSFQRRQTLVNGERYISPELKEYESKVLSAEERISSIENELFHQIRLHVAEFAPQVLHVAKALALVDCLHSLGVAARRYDYVRPVVDSSQTLSITAGRHPVIEAMLAKEKFTANDTLLDDDQNRLLVITGPNMAGKSTYIRQVALLTILAQMGSFVPAKHAHIGVVDKIFTRIGASDDLSRGQSTFMVEMTETANILNNATNRSLVILDEIGRGTSTYDGISIAWSTAEYLLTTPSKMAKTLFATHYFELTKLEEQVPGAVNYNVAVHESGDKILFLRKIVKGYADKSYGIHVADLAGLPGDVIDRAKEILAHLEESGNQRSLFEPSKPKRKATKVKTPDSNIQMTLFS